MVAAAVMEVVERGRAWGERERGREGWCRALQHGKGEQGGSREGAGEVQRGVQEGLGGWGQGRCAATACHTGRCGMALWRRGGDECPKRDCRRVV